MKKRIKQRTAKANPHTPSPSLSKIPWAELEKCRSDFPNHAKFHAPGSFSPFLDEHILPLAIARKLEAKESESHDE